VVIVLGRTKSMPEMKQTRADAPPPPPPVHWRIPPSDETDPDKLARALRERIKELNCLYGIAQLAERHPDSMDDFLAGVVRILPPSWQYPEITCARIAFEGRTFETQAFVATRRRQSARINLYGERVGSVDVFYTEERPTLHGGPFLREERALLDAIAERIGAVATRIAAERELHEIERQLTVERKALAESNAALKGVLARIEEEKREAHRGIQANVDKVLMPILYALALAVPRGKRKYVDLLRENLTEITSPFINQLSQRYASLTPAEVQICSMIRNGLSTKDIAQLRDVSTATVSRHREHIRRKLGLTNTSANLTTFLQTTM